MTTMFYYPITQQAGFSPAFRLFPDFLPLFSWVSIQDSFAWLELSVFCTSHFSSSTCRLCLSIACLHRARSSVLTSLSIGLFRLSGSNFSLGFRTRQPACVVCVDICSSFQVSPAFEGWKWRLTSVLVDCIEGNERKDEWICTSSDGLYLQ